MKLVLDTNIYSDYAEGLHEVVEILVTHGKNIFIPSVVLGELYYGFLKGRKQEHNEKKLQELVDRLQIEIIDVSRAVARKYSLIYGSLQKKGRKIPINDVWIAACCMEVGGTLLTRDKHFKYVDQIDSIVLETVNS